MAKTEVTAEVMHADTDHDNKIYFYRDKGMKQLVAYFLCEEVSGTDRAAGVQRYR